MHYGWEETTEMALTLLLKTALGKSGKGAEGVCVCVCVCVCVWKVKWGVFALCSRLVYFGSMHLNA